MWAIYISQQIIQLIVSREIRYSNRSKVQFTRGFYHMVVGNLALDALWKDSTSGPPGLNKTRLSNTLRNMQCFHVHLKHFLLLSYLVHPKIVHNRQINPIHFHLNSPFQNYHEMSLGQSVRMKSILNHCTIWESEGRSDSTFPLSILFIKSGPSSGNDNCRVHIHAFDVFSGALDRMGFS